MYDTFNSRVKNIRVFIVGELYNLKKKSFKPVLLSANWKRTIFRYFEDLTHG